MNEDKNSNEYFDKYWKNLFNKIERGISWLIFIFGIVLLITYWLYSLIEKILIDESMPLTFRIGLFATIFGFILLLFSIAKEKFLVNKRDKYLEIKR